MTSIIQTRQKLLDFGIADGLEPNGNVEVVDLESWAAGREADAVETWNPGG